MGVPKMTAWLGVVAAVAAFVAAGCGSSESSGSSAPAGESKAASGSPCVTEAKQLVAEARKPLPLKAPPGEVDMAKMKGKTLWVVSLTNTPFVKQATDGFMDAARSVGGTGKFFDAKGNITLANQGLATAVQQRAGGVVLFNVEPKNVSGELQKAKAAGVPVIDVQVGDPDQPLASGLYAHVTSDWTGIGKMFADYMLAETDCKLNALILSAKVLPILVNAQKGTEAEVKRLCPDCKTRTEWMDLASVATSLPRLAQTSLSREPNTNYITPMADAFASLVEPGITQAGKQIPIISHDGTDTALKEIRAGNGLLKATISTPPPVFFGWVFVDQLGRALADQEPADWTMPQQIIDSTNVAKTTDEQFPNYAGFEQKFKDAWGLAG